MVELIDARLDGHPIGSILSDLAAEIGAQRWVLLWRDGDRWGRLGVPGVRDDLLVQLADSGVGRLDRVRTDQIDHIGARLHAAGLSRLSTLSLDPDRPAVAFFEEPIDAIGPGSADAAWFSIALDAIGRAASSSSLSHWVSDALAVGNGTLAIEQAVRSLATTFELTGVVFAVPATRGASAQVLHTSADADPVLTEIDGSDADWRALAADPASALGWLPDDRVGARWRSASTASDQCSLLAVEGQVRPCESIEVVAELLGQSVGALRSNERRREQIRHAERTRLASTLHEELSQRLSALTIELDLLASQPRAAGLDDDLSRLRGQVVLALEALRSAIFELAPPEPDWAHLEAGLERFVEDLAATRDLRVDFRVDGAARPVVAEAISLVFASVQEALSNVSKHAGTQAARVSVVFADDALVVEIDDDGDGLLGPASTVADREHQGLAMLRTRARLAGAVLTVESVAGEGTTVRLEVPMARRDEVAR